MVSTQPELPMRCCTIQAMAIRTESDSAIPARASRYKTVMQKPVNRLRHQRFVKYAVHLNRVSRRSSLFPCEIDRNWLFSRPLCHIGARNRLLATDDTGNAFSLLFPLRDGDRTDQTVLASDFPAVDAGVPGALRTG